MHRLLKSVVHLGSLDINMSLISIIPAEPEREPESSCVIYYVLYNQSKLDKFENLNPVITVTQ